MSKQASAAEPTSDLVEIRALHAIHHNGDQHLPGSVFFTDRKTAEYLIARESAILATETTPVPVEQQLPAGMDPVFGWRTRGA